MSSATPHPDLAQLRAALVAARAAKAMSQADLAASMGTSQSAVSDLESGAGDPRLSTVARWAGALGLRLAHRERVVVGDAIGPHLLNLPNGEPVRLDPDALTRADRAPITSIVGETGSGRMLVSQLVRQWANQEGRTLLEVSWDGVLDAAEADAVGPGTVVLIEEVAALSEDSHRTLQSLCRSARKRQLAIFLSGTSSAGFADLSVFSPRVICLRQSHEKVLGTLAVFGMEPRPERVAELETALPGCGLFREADGSVHSVRLVLPAEAE